MLLNLMLISVSLGHFAFFSMPGVFAGQQQTSISLERIQRDWQGRKNRLVSLDASWKADYTSMRKGPVNFGPSELKIDPKMPKVWTFQKTVHYAVNGRGMYKVQYNNVLWDPLKSEYVNFDVVLLNDGKFSKQFFSKDSDGRPSFHIRAAKDKPTPTYPFAVPIHLAMNTADFANQLAVASLKIEVPNGEDDADGVVIIRDGEHTLWLDANKEYVPVRYYHSKFGKTIRSIRIQYREDEKRFWVPASWEDANNEYSEVVEVTKCKINEDLAVDFFDMDAPANTFVRNYLTNEMYLQRVGDKRPLKSGELTFQNFDQLLATEPAKNFWYGWPLGLAAGLIIVLLLMLRIGRRLKKLRPR